MNVNPLALLRMLLVVLFGSVVLIVFSGSREIEAATLPRCGVAPLSTSPLALSDISYILPLGNLNPPDHTVPTDHIYFILPRGENAVSTVVPMVAPGNIVVTSINVTFYYTGSKLTDQDYSLGFAACREVSGRFGHVSSLSKALKSKLGKWDDCTSYPAGTPGKSYKQCRKNITLSVKAGGSLGTAGGKLSAALDLWVYDTRVDQRPKFVNSSRYPEIVFTTACPLNYFRSSVKQQLLVITGNGQSQRTVAPVCGSFTQDKPGTLQGNWFTQNANDEPRGWTKELALVHQNYDGTTAAVSIGGVFASAGVWNFTPQHSGTVNREFSEVRPGPDSYCYERESAYKTADSGRILIQLVNATTLKIERQDGTCQDRVELKKPATYKR